MEDDGSNQKELTTATTVPQKQKSDIKETTSTNQIEKLPVVKKSGLSKLAKLLADDDPKPGPSTTAAEFDLEVFDSGSSCSNEECWTGEIKGEKPIVCAVVESVKGATSLTVKMDECTSDGEETELTATRTKRHNRETQTGSDLLESAASPGPSTSQEEKSSELPEETIGRRESVELWKSRNETETIVEDHDVYGTDENEDSLDSLHNEDSMDSLAISSRRTSLCGDQSEVIVLEQNLSRCCSRASNPDSLTDTPEVEDSHQPICDLYTQTCSSSTKRSYEVKTSQTESKFFQPLPSTSISLAPSSLLQAASSSLSLQPVAASARDEVEMRPLVQTANTQTEAENFRLMETEPRPATEAVAESFRPKRKSGSFTELSLPLKKQRPEATSPKPFSFKSLASSIRESEPNPLESTPGSSGSTTTTFGGEHTPLGDSSGIENPLLERETPDCTLNSFNIEESPFLAALCDNTAPTSPASPASCNLDDEDDLSEAAAVSPTKPNSRALFSPGFGRNLIPDRENPPPEILSWVSTFSGWSNAARLAAINQLINACEPQQVRHMMQVIEPQFQRDFISLLPKELALYVLSYLEPKDLLRAAQTCRYWRVLAEDNLLWREKCREAGLSDCREYPRRRKTTHEFIYSPWKAGFMRQHNIEMNWRINPVRSPKVLKGHDDHVITCLQFSGNRIVSGSDDNTLKVWSAVTGKCLRTLSGHTGGVWSSQMQGNTIVSGSTDRTLKVWNAESGSCVHTLYGHTSTVRCMHLHNNKVVSGSRDATLRMWDIETGECNMVLVGHVAAVRCVQYDGRLVVSGAYDYMVKVWNPEREECIHTLSGHTNRVYSLQFDGVHVVSGSLDTSIRVWDVENGACKHALMGHQSLTSGMELKDNILVSGNADSTVKIWDILTGQCLQTLSGPNKHQSAVTCLHFNKKFVVTSSDDGTVKLWDVKTGDYIRDLVSLESGGSGGVVWRIRSSPTKLVCAVGSRNGTEETKLLVLDFENEVK